MSNLNKAKVLILGRTGVGKSSFINYLLNANEAKVGMGEPVTQEMFNKYEYKDENGMKIEIIDTKGIEVKDAHEYVPKLIKNIIDNCTSEDPTKWYHTVFYCVSMNNQRFEPFEIKLINELSKNINQNIHIVLTHFKEDEVDKVNNMEDYIKKQLDRDIEDINFYRVCSVNKKTRGGEIRQYGRELVVNSIFETFLKDVSKKVSKQYAKESYEAYVKLINNMEKDFIKVIEENVSIFKFKDFDNGKLDKKFDEMNESIEYKYEKEISILSDKFNEVIIPIQEIYNSYEKILNKSESNYICLDSIFDDLCPFDEKVFNVDGVLYKSDLGKFMTRLEEISFDEGINFESIKIMGEAVKKILFIKSEFIKVVEFMFKEMKKDFNKLYIEKRMYDLLCDKLLEKSMLYS